MSRIRLFFTSIILFFLVGAGVAWVLSNQDIIQNSWALPLGTAFSVLGVLVAFVQWTIPLPSSDPKPSTESAKSSHAREIFFKQIQDRLTGGTGALVIYEKSDNIGKSISASRGSGDQFEEVKASIVERIVNGYPLSTAIFPGLKSGTYGISGPSVDHERITVFSGHVAEVDWRRTRSWEEEREMEKKIEWRKKSQPALRIKSVMIGLGGVLFLIHRYMIIPYLDTAGISLMALGVTNMLSSFVLDWLGWWQNYSGEGYRAGLFVIELGGVLFLVHKYMMISYLDIVGIILMGLGGIWLIICAIGNS